MSDRHDPEDDRMTAAFTRLEGHMLDVLQTQARHGEALAGINRRLDILNGKVAAQEAKNGEFALKLAEAEAAQKQELSSHVTTCEVKVLIEEIRRQLAANTASEVATKAANRSWWEELRPVVKSIAIGLGWIIGAMLVFHHTEISKAIFKQ
jgi:hypothetical protein